MSQSRNSSGPHQVNWHSSIKTDVSFFCDYLSQLFYDKKNWFLLFCDKIDGRWRLNAFFCKHTCYSKGNCWYQTLEILFLVASINLRIMNRNAFSVTWDMLLILAIRQWKANITSTELTQYKYPGILKVDIS